jgi:cholesterol transport system auxiliary component
MIRRSFLMRGAASLLPACGFQLPGQGDPPQLYTLTPKSTFTADLPKADWQLIVEPPIAAAGLHSSRIALQRTPVSVDYFARVNWTDLAPMMVQTLLIESFENTAKIVAVSRESTRLRADFHLQTELREFQAEYFPDATKPPTVRVRMLAKLIRMPDRIIVDSMTAERTWNAERDALPAIVIAFDEALGGVMRRIVEWTLRTGAASPRAQPRS